MAELRQHEAPTLDPRLAGKGARCPTCHCWITASAQGTIWYRWVQSHWTDPQREGVPGEIGACNHMGRCECACADCACHRSDESARELLLSLVT